MVRITDRIYNDCGVSSYSALHSLIRKAADLWEILHQNKEEINSYPPNSESISARAHESGGGECRLPGRLVVLSMNVVRTLNQES
jgi:hypothetical protein